MIGLLLLLMPSIPVQPTPVQPARVPSTPQFEAVARAAAVVRDSNRFDEAHSPTEGGIQFQCRKPLKSGSTLGTVVAIILDRPQIPPSLIPIGLEFECLLVQLERRREIEIVVKAYPEDTDIHFRLVHFS